MGAILNRYRKPLCALLIALLTAILCLPQLIPLADKAWAAGDFEGDGWIYSTNPGGGDWDYTDYVLSTSIGDVMVYCCQHGVMHMPESDGGIVHYTATYLGSSIVDRWDTQDDTWIYHHAVTEESYDFYVNAGDNQDVAGTGSTRSEAVTKERRTGSLDLQKISTNTSLTNENDCYRLAGAVYEVQNSSGEKVSTLTTDDNGYAKIDGLWVDDYTIKETTPPEGYALDTNTYKVHVSADATVRVNGKTVSDSPIDNPLETLVQKLDATTGNASPLGNATLIGAEFSVQYYDGFYETAAQAKASGPPTRTWTMTTDEKGFASFDANHIVAAKSDALYHHLGGGNDGAACIPRGTVVVTETKAPQGYLLAGSDHAPIEPYVAQITSDSASITSGVTTTLNMKQIPDVAEYGDYRLVKEISITADNKDGSPQEIRRILVPGIRFQLINDSSHAVVSPEDGRTLVQPGSVVCTITTDENGLASTKSGQTVNGWSIPSGWTGALAYGTYSVHEIIPDSVAAEFEKTYGTKPLPVEDFKTTIDAEGSYAAPTLVNNKIPQTPLRIVKQDRETGMQIPLPCSFQLFDAKGELVTYTSHYPNTNTQDTWTTNAQGELTLPFLLEGGTYTIKEVAAPEGYTINNASFTVTVDEYRTWDNPLVVQVDDAPIKGKVIVAKTDANNAEAVAGAEYAIKAASDIVTKDGTVRFTAGEVIAHQTTDAAGIATFAELYLGSYAVYETKTASGYALDPDEHLVSVESQGQEIPVVEVGLALADVPTTIVVNKISSAASAVCLEGARFHIWQDAAETEVGKDSLTFDQTAVSDSEGKITLSHLKPGSYHIQEIEAPAGYVITEPGKVIDFSVNDQGFVLIAENTMGATGSITVQNTPIALHTTAVDTSTAAHESQASKTLSLVDTVEYTGLTAGKKYVMTGTLMNKATGKPLEAGGSAVTSSITFTPEKSAGTVEVLFEFDGSALAGTEIVVFEDCSLEGETVVAHAEINDEGQTVKIVDIKTTATNDASGDHEGTRTPDMTLTDTVSYTGLTVGQEYTLTGTLMDRETGKPLMAAGKRVSATCTFTPETADGTVDMTFTFDSTEIAGTACVVFEECYRGETLIATHADLDDEGQTVVFPGIKTTATNADDKSHFASSNGEVAIDDKVEYTGLMAGKQYTMSGTLIDKSTGEPLLVNGEKVTSSIVFTPQESDGSINMSFTFDANALGDRDVVVFEDCSRNDLLVGRHADIDDSGQTVSLRSSPAAAVFDKTGNLLLHWWWAVLPLTAGSIGGIVWGLRRRHARNVLRARYLDSL